MAKTPLDRLKMMTAWDKVPTLSNTEVQDILDQFAKADADGLAPTDEDWTPTYAMRAAARQGWVIKMGKASELQSTDLDGDRMSANQIFAQCERMVRKYSSTGSPAMGTTVSTGETNVAAESAFE